MRIRFNLEKIIILIFLILTVLKLVETNRKLIKETYIPGFNQTSFNNLIEFLNLNKELNYYFTPEKNSYKNNLIYLKIGTYQNKKINCQIKINLYEETNNNINWLSGSIDDCKKINDNQFNNFILKNEVDLLKTKKYLLKINIDGSKKDNLAFYYLNKDSNHNKLFITTKDNLQKNYLNGELTLFIGKKTLSGKSFLYSLISLFIFVSLVFIYIITVKLLKKKTYPKLIFLFLIGLIWLIIIPPFHGSDEHEHFTRIAEISSFHISSARYNSQFSDYYEGYKNLIDNTLWKADFLTRNIFFETMSSFSINLGKKTQTGFTLAAAYNPFSHLHLTIIMKILEILKFKPILIFYLLRLVNLLLFLSLIYLSIKIYPKLKEFIFLLATFPAVISQAAVISTDSIITASIIYSFFYVLTTKKRKSSFEKFFLFFSLVYISFTKYVYSIITLITIIKLFIDSNKKSLLKILSTLSVVFIIFVINILWLKYINYNPENKDIRFENTNPQEQITKIKKNPLYYFTLYNNYSLNNLISKLEMGAFTLSNNYRQITSDIYLSSIAIFIFFLISLQYAFNIENSKFNLLYIVFFVFSSYLITVILTLIFSISYQNLFTSNRYYGFYLLLPISLGFIFKKFYKLNFNLDLITITLFINILNLIISFNLFLPLWFN